MVDLMSTNLIEDVNSSSVTPIVVKELGGSNDVTITRISREQKGDIGTTILSGSLTTRTIESDSSKTENVPLEERGNLTPEEYRELKRLTDTLTLIGKAHVKNEPFSDVVKLDVCRAAFLVEKHGLMSKGMFFREIRIDYQLLSIWRQKFSLPQFQSTIPSVRPPRAMKEKIVQSEVSHPPEPEAHLDWIRTDVATRTKDLSHNEEADRNSDDIAKDIGLTIGNDPAMQRVWQQTQRAAKGDGHVLLRGETGTGKELISEAIHLLHRKNEEVKFHRLNCAGLSEGLLSSELFGHVKGAFTGANGERTDGAFRIVANGGTLLLDEIGDMPPLQQGMLLRVLENREFSPVGSNTVLKLNGAKIVAATNQPLEQLVEEGKFRKDLYYRLAHNEIVMPRLDERSLDHRTELIGQHLLRRSTPECRFFMRPEALALLQKLQYPGNVRELLAHVDRAAEMASTNFEGEILIIESDIQATIGKSQEKREVTTDVGEFSSHFNEALQLHTATEGTVDIRIAVEKVRQNFYEIISKIESEIIHSALERKGHHQTATADQLGVNRTKVRVHSQGRKDL